MNEEGGEVHFVQYLKVHVALYNIQVSTELVVHAERSPGFHFNLREVRKRMVGQETSDLLR